MRTIEGVIVGYQNVWRKWPDSEDRDYSSVLAKRELREYTVAGESIVVCMRWYPAHRAYVLAGVNKTPVWHPSINNTVLPPQSVMDAMLKDLTDIANDSVTLCYWEHAYQCYPYVAQHLKRIFKHSILMHADDCPGSTELKTEPIAKYFDSVIHGNVIWHPNGELTSSLYNRLGIQDTHYVALGVSAGFMKGLDNELSVGQVFSVEDRIEQLREGGYSYDMVFVGGALGDQRAILNEDKTTALFKAAGLRTRILGVGMRDGTLHPRIPPDLGTPVAAVYLSAFSVLNMPMVGLMGTRPFDAWASGTLLIQQEMTHELRHLGILSGEHYAPFNGTMEDLIRVVRYHQEHFDETVKMIRAGYKYGMELSRRYNSKTAMESILTKARNKWKQ